MLESREPCQVGNKAALSVETRCVGVLSPAAVFLFCRMPAWPEVVLKQRRFSGLRFGMIQQTYGRQILNLKKDAEV